MLPPRGCINRKLEMAVEMELDLVIAIWDVVIPRSILAAMTSTALSLLTFRLVLCFLFPVEKSSICLLLIAYSRCISRYSFVLCFLQMGSWIQRWIGLKFNPLGIVISGIWQDCGNLIIKLSFFFVMLAAGSS